MLSQLKTTPRYIELLTQHSITTMKDFLQYFPRTYESRDQVSRLDQTRDTITTITIRALVSSKKISPRPWGKQIWEIHCIDSSGLPCIVYLRSINYQRTKYEINKRYLLTTKPKKIGRNITLRHPEITETHAPIETNTEESLPSSHLYGRLYPIYPELQGIKPDRFAKKIRESLTLIPQYFAEYLPDEFIKRFELMDVPTTIKQLHFPDSRELKEQAQYRLFFDRLLRIQLHSLMSRTQYQQHIHTPPPIDRSIIKQITSQLPFSLTDAQKKVIVEIINNISTPKPMMRLLQWDVWSGKTIVAAICAYYIIKQTTWQVAVLAPLEILAQQHYRSLAKILLPLSIRIEILTWSLTAKQKQSIKEDLKNGRINIIVGTHALIQDSVKFNSLSMVIIDEQHKFGVQQRAFFKQFNHPHILQMSATPIPRSLALAFFGEFDVSIIDQMPAGRKPIITKITTEHQRNKLKPRIINKIENWQKVFAVTPLIEDNEELENLKSAQSQYEHLKVMFESDNIKVWLMHGGMKSKEKEAIMQNFKTGNIKILVATTVIEVGVDIPEATIMIIYNSERFWLSQLHQLRGRIGRNDLQSYCFLETRIKSGPTYQRLKAMEDTTDGFKLAQIDLQYRGSGEILGTRQAGDTDIPLEVISDLSFVQKAKSAAEYLLELFPNLEGLPSLQHTVWQTIGTILY